MFLLWPSDPCKGYSSLACKFHPFIASFVASFIPSFTHSLTQSVNQSLAHPFTYLTHLDSARLRSTPPQSGQVKSSQVKSSQVKSSQVKSSQVKSSQVKSSQAHSPPHLFPRLSPIHPFTHSPIHTLTITHPHHPFTHPVHSSKHSFISLVHLGAFTSSITLTHALVLLAHSFTQPRVQSPSRPCTPSSIHSFFIHPFDQLSRRLSTDSLCHEVTHTYPRAFSSTLPPPQRCLLATPFGPGLLNRRSAGGAQKTSRSKMCKLATDVILPGHAHVSLTKV